MVETARRRTASEDSGLSAARRRAILQARARDLARRTEDEAEARPGIDALVCPIGASLYALPLAEIAHVKPFARWGAAVGRDPALLGLVSEEGRVCPVFDLARLVSPADATAPQSGWLIVLAAPRSVALRVETLPEAAAIQPLEDADGDRARVLGGAYADRHLVVLSPDTLFDRSQPALHGAEAP